MASSSADASTSADPKPKRIRNDREKRSQRQKELNLKKHKAEWAAAGKMSSYTKGACLAHMVADEITEGVQQMFDEHRQHSQTDMNECLDQRLGPVDDMTGMTPDQRINFVKTKLNRVLGELAREKTHKMKTVEKEKQDKVEAKLAKQAEVQRRKQAKQDEQQRKKEALQQAKMEKEQRNGERQAIPTVESDQATLEAERSSVSNAELPDKRIRGG